jgi:hypothetical protein
MVETASEASPPEQGDSREALQVGRRNEAQSGTSSLTEQQVPASVLDAARPHLTGDTQADKDIMAFFVARHKVLSVHAK